MDAARCACSAQSNVTAGAALAPSDPEGVDRHLVRTDSLSNAHDETTRIFSVHYHTAYASGTPTQHVVRVGTQAGVHMCSCLELAHRGLPCRHCFAVLLHDQSLQFDVDVIHPRWLTPPTKSLLPPCDDTPKLYSPAYTERMKVVQYLSMDAIRHKIEQLAGDVRGLKSKAEYAERLVSLEFDVGRKAQATLLTSVAQADQPAEVSHGDGQHNSSTDGDSMDVVTR
jgi:SWIM zinc finger